MCHNRPSDCVLCAPPGHRNLLSVEPDLLATEILAFPSKSSRNKNDSDLTIANL